MSRMTRKRLAKTHPYILCILGILATDTSLNYDLQPKIECKQKPPLLLTGGVKLMISKHLHNHSAWHCSTSWWIHYQFTQYSRYLLATSYIAEFCMESRVHCYDGSSDCQIWHLTSTCLCLSMQSVVISQPVSVLLVVTDSRGFPQNGYPGHFNVRILFLG